MKKILALSLLSLFIFSCGSSKKGFSINNDEGNSRNTDKTIGKTAQEVVDNAMEYKGTPYKYGGTTKRGMDCSGLVYVSFQKEDISLPRTSRAMSLEGKRLKMKEIQPGDLLFFQTNKNRKVVNHVGIVVEVKQGEISFIHSSTSRGVIVSNLDQPYWNEAFLMARRVL